MKKQPEYAGLKEAHSQVLQQSMMNLDRAFQNFFAKRAKDPKIKRKHGVQSIRFPQYFFVLEKHISVPKIGKVRVKIHRPSGREAQEPDPHENQVWSVRCCDPGRSGSA